MIPFVYVSNMIVEPPCLFLVLLHLVGSSLNSSAGALWEQNFLCHLSFIDYRT